MHRNGYARMVVLLTMRTRYNLFRCDTCQATLALEEVWRRPDSPHRTTSPLGWSYRLHWCNEECHDRYYQLRADQAAARAKIRRAWRWRSERVCAHCGTPFTPKRSDARYHSGACRVAAHRARTNEKAPRAVDAGAMTQGDAVHEHREA